MATRILGSDGHPLRRERTPSAPMVRARYDAAQTTTDNSRWWANADNLSARSANSPEVRKKLRERARYESANNSYCRGIVLTLANDLIGTGPRLQLMGPDAAINRSVAIAFESWTAEVSLAERLRTLRQARAVDGEAFALLTTNSRIRHPVQLDLRLIEADQVTSPYLTVTDPLMVDGIRFDRQGNPVSYTVLDEHPGDSLQFTFNQYSPVPAELVLHWFRCDRPGQVRGVPDLTPALPLFAQLRRYTLAVIAAAETAADFAAMLYSELPADAESLEGTPFETLEIERRMMTTLPAGWRIEQLRAEQPTTTYEMFKHEILNEIARCLNMPFNVAAGNSSGYNYSSGRLDHQTYYKSIAVDQYHLETAVLDRILTAWLHEAALVGTAPRDASNRPWPHQWFWDGQRHVDPTKEATAQETRLRIGLTTLADEWAAEGYDWREKADQQAIERAYYAERGIPYPGDAAPTPTPTTPTSNDPGGDDADPTN